MGACHVDLGAAYLGAYPGVGAYHSIGRNSYLGAYPGDYGIIRVIFLYSLKAQAKCYKLSTQKIWIKIILVKKTNKIK